tara:strand:+ start:241 stop:465 length:225 start_codon:yes stop_codon:yes gene_type:complete
MRMYVVMRREGDRGSPEMDSICLSWGAAKDRVLELKSINNKCRALGEPKSYFWFRKVPVTATPQEITDFAKHRS